MPPLGHFSIHRLTTSHHSRCVPNSPSCPTLGIAHTHSDAFAQVSEGAAEALDKLAFKGIPASQLPVSVRERLRSALQPSTNQVWLACWCAARAIVWASQVRLLALYCFPP